jgi:hypothetical protein
VLTEYHTFVVGGVARVLVGCILLFGLLPRLLWPTLLEGDTWRRRMGGFLLSGALVVLIVHVLVLGSMYDGVVFVTVCLALWAFRIWREESASSGKGLANYFAGVLRLVDVISWSYVVKAGKRRMRELAERASMFDVFMATLLLAVIAMTGFIRLVPVWNHAAPLSVEYYDTLRQTKQLQVNQILDGGYYVPLGLPALAQTLSLISQVNVALILHFLGAVSSMLLAGSIAYVVYRASFSIPGAIIGASLFGLFSVFLPMDLRSQVEADGMILASAFALPALSYLVEYFDEPSRQTFVVALAGLVAAASINLFVGFVSVIAALLIPLPVLALSFRLAWLRGKKLWLVIAAGGLFLCGILLFFTIGLESESTRNVLGVLLYDKHLNRYFAMYDGLSTQIVQAAAALFGMMVLLSVVRYSRKSAGLQLLVWGALGAVSLLVIPMTLTGQIGILQFGQLAFVLALLTAVAAGSLAGILCRAGGRLLDRMQAKTVLAKAWSATVVAAASLLLWVYSSPPAIAFDYTAEPDGFAASIYMIEQRYMPYQWTVVSHMGTALVGMNRGRFLDYDYFCQRYDPLQYNHGVAGAVPTPVLFFFVERENEQSEIVTELATSNRESARNMNQWLAEYQKHHRDLTIFYRDEKVVVYKIEDPTIKALRG